VVHTLAVVAEAHLGLAETNGILASANAIELLELGLVDALKGGTVKSALRISGVAIGHVGDTHLRREVDLNGLDADVLGAGRHGGGGVVYGWRGRRMESTQHRQEELRDRRERERQEVRKGKSLYKLKVLPGKCSRATRKRRLLCTRIYSVRSVTVTIFFFWRRRWSRKHCSSFEPNNDSSIGIKSVFRVWINS
jgi:hypothetical protein